MDFRRFISNSVSAYGKFTKHFRYTISIIENILEILCTIAAVAAVCLMTLRFGYEHDVRSAGMITSALRSIQTLFAVNVLFRLLFDFRRTVHDTKPIKWISDTPVLLPSIALLIPVSSPSWMQYIYAVLDSKILFYGVIMLYSVLTLSNALFRTLDRRTNPTLILAVSFLLLIVAGALILMMPKCHYPGTLSFTDSFFLATSAVCITGLTPVEVADTLTPSGILVLALLMQTGGLGVMTFTSFFALFFSGNATIYSQLMVRDMVYTRSMDSLLPTLLYILLFTLTVEAIGAGVILLCVHGILGITLEEEVWFSVFHSMSAFCNAGFSNVEGGLSNPLLLKNGQGVYLAVSAIVFAGGIGFPVLVNFKDAIFFHIRNTLRRLTGHRRMHRISHLYNMNTKIALLTTVIILAASVILFLVFEWQNSLAGMSPADKLTQAIFNSLSPRSSGFTSINPAGFMNITILLLVFLMWIGGASQSTAGGIKVNTFATMLLNLRSIITGKKNVTAFSRTISTGSLRRANAVIAVSLLSLTVYTITLVALEPDLPLKALVFESVSALFTVGSSLGITSSLSMTSKILLCTAMFAGRVGLLSLLTGLFAKECGMEPVYPTDNIIIT